MSLKEEDRQVLVTLELEKVDKILAQLEVQLQGKLWEMAANRLYYALFHAVNALLISDGHPVNTHKGAHALFNLNYIKSGIMPVEYGKLYNQLQTMREESDYNCVYDVEPEELKNRIEPARQLINRVESYISEKK